MTSVKKHKKIEQVKIYADSHGRNLASLVSDNNIKGTNFEVSGMVKPGATFKQISPSVDDTEDLSSKDWVVLMAGSNDVSKNETKNANYFKKNLS